MKRMAITLIVALGASAVGCGEKQTDGRPEPAGPHVTKFRIGRAVAPNGTVTIEGDSFALGEPVYMSFEVKKVPPKSRVKVVWTDSSKKQISLEQKEISSGTGAVSFEMRDAGGLPAGDYLVEFFTQVPDAPEKWLSLGHKSFRVGLSRS